MDISMLKYDRPTDLLEPAHCTRMGVVPKDIYLVINWESQIIYIGKRKPEYREGAAEVRCGGREDAYRLSPSIDASRLRYWVEDEILPRVEPLAKAYRGDLYDPAEDQESRRFPGREVAKAKFDVWMTVAARPPRHSGGLMTADGWLDTGLSEVRPDSSDSELKRFAEMIVADTAVMNIIIVGGEDTVFEYLRDFRDFKALRESRYAQKEDVILME